MYTAWYVSRSFIILLLLNASQNKQYSPEMSDEAVISGVCHRMLYFYRRSLLFRKYLLNFLGLSGSFRCSCKEPYGGLTCEDFQPCESSPCLNGATCTTTNTGYRCTCTVNYVGMSTHYISSCTLHIFPTPLVVLTILRPRI